MAVLNRAYSVLRIKSVDAQKRTITGTATTPTSDRMGDIIEPLGVKFTNPLPLLLYHNSQKPVGRVAFSKPTAKGIDFEATLPTIVEPGVVKDRIDEAWQSLNADPPLIGGVSIGFRPIEESYMPDTGSWRYLQCEVLELSLVVIPANPDATITAATVKSFDRELAASGTEPAAAARPTPGASGHTRVSTRTGDHSMKKSYADQIATWEATRKAKTDRMDAILDKSAETGVTLDAAEQEEHDTLETEVKDIDAQIKRLKSAQVREAAAAVPARGTDTDAASRSRGVGHVVTIERKLPPGIGFARYAMCMGLARGNPFEAKQLAKDNYGDDAGALVRLIDLQQKAAVGGAATSVGGWASELVPYNIMDDFIEYLRPRTILGKFGTEQNGVKIPALRNVPFNTRVSGFSAGLSATWVGEGLPALVSAATSFTTALTWAKIAALAVLTKEEMRFSNPSAEAKVRDDISRAVIARMDIDFINPAKAAVANVSPASITYNTAPLAPSGATAAAFRTDFATLLGTFATLLLDPTDIVIIMSTIDALNLSLMINTLGVQSFPNITMAGGSILGFPVITSEAMVSEGSPLEDIIVAVKAGDIYLSDDGVVTVDASDQASVEMVNSSVQSGVTGTGASMVSFWQSGLLGLLAVREVNWKLRRTGAARYLGPALYRA